MVGYEVAMRPCIGQWGGCRAAVLTVLDVLDADDEERGTVRTTCSDILFPPTLTIVGDRLLTAAGRKHNAAGTQSAAM